MVGIQASSDARSIATNPKVETFKLVPLLWPVAVAVEDEPVVVGVSTEEVVLTDLVLVLVSLPVVSMVDTEAPVSVVTGVATELAGVVAEPTGTEPPGVEAVETTVGTPEEGTTTGTDAPGEVAGVETETPVLPAGTLGVGTTTTELALVTHSGGVTVT